MDYLEVFFWHSHWGE